MSVVHDSDSCAGGADAAAALRDGVAVLRDDADAALRDDAAALEPGGALVVRDSDAPVLGLSAVPAHAVNASTSTMSAIHPLAPGTTLMLLAFARFLTPAANLDD